jgi:hypothetical protein
MGPCVLAGFEPTDARSAAKTCISKHDQRLIGMRIAEKGNYAATAMHISDRPIYVGQGQKISARLRDHVEKFWFRPPIVQNAAFVGIDNKELREQIEKVLIKFLKSNAVLNQQNVDR